MTGAQVHARCWPARSATPAAGRGGPSRRGSIGRDRDGAARLEAQAAQAARRFGAEVERAVARHRPAVGRVHRDVVRSGAPHVRHFAVRGGGQERAPAGPQDHLAHRRIGVQPQLRPAEQAHAQVEHLQREPVAAGVVVLLNVAAPLEDGEQAVDGGGGLAELPPQLADRQAARRLAQRLADLERLVDRGRRRLRLSLVAPARSILRNGVPVPPGYCTAALEPGTRTANRVGFRARPPRRRLRRSSCGPRSLRRRRGSA